jgi:hypothetical protein
MTVTEIRDLDDERSRALGAEHALERERVDHNKTRRELRQADARIRVLERKLARKKAA